MDEDECLYHHSFIYLAATLISPDTIRVLFKQTTFFTVRVMQGSCLTSTLPVCHSSGHI